jgi:HK97 gp10 family phage protein
MTTVNVEGLDGLLDRLKALPKEMSGKAGGPAKKALIAGSIVIRDEARRLAPKDTGLLSANIIHYRAKLTSGKAEMVKIGVRTGSRKYGKTVKNVRKGIVGQEYKTRGDAYYWYFFEFGTEKMAARPFLRPAFESKKDEALEQIAVHLRKQIEILERKASKR